MLALRSLSEQFSRSLHFIRNGSICSKFPIAEHSRQFHVMGSPLLIHCTPMLSGEPLKKRKRIDPSIVREKAEKKAKRLMRDIRKLEKVAKRYKPLGELEVPRKILKESNRVRPSPVLSEEEIHMRADHEKEWAVYKYEQHKKQMNVIRRMVACQEKALDALQEASPELYHQALQVDTMLIPLKMTGPTRTPPIENFDFPEGDYIDVTQKYLPIVQPVVKKRKIGVTKKKAAS